MQILFLVVAVTSKFVDVVILAAYYDVAVVLIVTVAFVAASNLS